LYSTDYPVEGCYCCDKYEPLDDTGKTGKQSDIYRTCVDGAAPAAGKDGGRYQKCFNEINVAKHNAYRKSHARDGSTALVVKKPLAEAAEAYAKKLKD
jgi:hypothetical protein